MGYKTSCLAKTICQEFNKTQVLAFRFACFLLTIDLCCKIVLIRTCHWDFLLADYLFGVNTKMLPFADWG